MAGEFVLFLVLLVVVGAFLRQDFIFTIVYLLAGAYIVGGLWSRRSLQGVRLVRHFTNRAFLNEEVPVRLEAINTSWLPVVWLRVYDSLPVNLAIQKTFRQVISLGPYERASFHYVLQARKRGYYQLGPTLSTSGDLVGLVGELGQRGPADYLTVYPKIVPITRLRLPSRSPMGTLRHTQPGFEDPARISGKRDYVSGDSLRRVDWKSSAALGRLQVKLYEPSIALETMVFLNLNTEEYELHSRIDATELGIVVAASIANWVSSQKQSVGLITNGLDPQVTNDAGEAGKKRELLPIEPLPARKGRGHLVRLLDILARVQPGRTQSLIHLIRREYLNLPWGTTLIVITGGAEIELFDALFQVRRAGMSVVLILVGMVPYTQEICKRAEQFGLPVYAIRNEHELDRWRR